ncbi:hypothetical protein [Thalassotalea piscium]|uniref:Uncharacterized protein n=1 Tax=Thalassotalea piscium TaxID=1230533 RepID=A0A7X0NF77_9GAMM|nr:hypothetical protein [Thalassotalea piscium]MBB6542285.1 hypothetical protein [Thalassotalea piscium]
MWLRSQLSLISCLSYFNDPRFAKVALVILLLGSVDLSVYSSVAFEKDDSRST